jgi:16S rRNA (adenine1518-N6/adenine1519-N6)-dimethyltransferase
MTTAKRRFGQNFLVDHNVVERIIAAVRPQSDETIVEIGSGRGALTSRLLERAGSTATWFHNYAHNSRLLLI